MIERVDVVEASISELELALQSGSITSVGLVNEYLRRIAHFDRDGPRLNAVPVLNSRMFDEARESDDRRARGESQGRLEGIPFTVKDSYLTQGLPSAAGSPAFADLLAQRDAFTVERLRAAGAILIGHTNMCPLANGGMQRGLYGRTESPYNPLFLAAGYVSGSSHGSGVATATSMSAFGLGEETWSSGRSPASNNALCAYTPSRGVISIRGNWPLTPTMDVVVPHTRSIADLRALLDILVVDDPDTRGDFWREQPWVPIPAASEFRPTDFEGLNQPKSLSGLRIGVPSVYIGRRSKRSEPIDIHPDVLALWETARTVLESCGATIIEVDFPVVDNYGTHQRDTATLVDRGFLPQDFIKNEVHDLSAWAVEDFLKANGDPRFDSLATVDGSKLFPLPTGTIPDVIDHYGPEYLFDLAEYVHIVQSGVPRFQDIPTIRDGAIGLEAARIVDLEDWMDQLSLDALVFPAAADVGREDAERNSRSYEHSWRKGVGVSNGGLAIRHYGIPTVTVPMGSMKSTNMPVGLTFAGRAYSDWKLISYAGAFEDQSPARRVPDSTPALSPTSLVEKLGAPNSNAPRIALNASLSESGDSVSIQVSSDADEVEVFVRGLFVPLDRNGDSWEGSVRLPVGVHDVSHSEWRGAYGSIVQAIASTRDGRGTVGAFTGVGGIL